MTPEEVAEIQMCDECISHLMENAGPDHIIVKYRTALIKLEEQAEEIKQLKDHHCEDCCCARSWEALGITEYTGRSIPEEISRIREQMFKNRDIATDLQYICDDQYKEIKRLEDALVEERAWRNFFAANARTEALADFGYSLVKDRHFTRAREQLRDEGAIR